MKPCAVVQLCTTVYNFLILLTPDPSSQMRRGGAARLVLDPVEVAKLLWQDGLLTDNQLDNGVEAFPSVHAPGLLHTQQLFLFFKCLEKLPHTLVQWYHLVTK